MEDIDKITLSKAPDPQFVIQVTHNIWKRQDEGWNPDQIQAAMLTVYSEADPGFPTTKNQEIEFAKYLASKYENNRDTFPIRWIS